MMLRFSARESGDRGGAERFENGYLKQDAMVEGASLRDIHSEVLLTN